MGPSTIGTINLLPDDEKRAMYVRYVPAELLTRFNLPSLTSKAADELLDFRFAPGSSDVEISVYHKEGFPDPVLYGHLADTLSGQIHILLYILNDPDSPRFDVDKMPDGSPTKFGTSQRNIEAEVSAMQAGLAPGQIRKGLRMLGQAIETFEKFATELGHDMYFIEPLYYHNALLFERYGFAYQMGRQVMEVIHTGFQPGGDLHSRLDASSPFRGADAAATIRKRSWAIHDGILGEPFTNVTMYKRVGKQAGLNSAPGCDW
jgi:hypothetical protein